MELTEVRYLIFMRADCSQVWAGLTAPEFTRQYWLHENVSGWEPGSKWEHVSIGEARTVDIAGEVVASEPGKILELTWAQPGKSDPPSRVRFDLTDQPGWPGGPWTEVRFAHTELIADSEMHTSVSWGWPAVFSGLKTLLECGGLERSE